MADMQTVKNSNTILQERFDFYVDEICRYILRDINNGAKRGKCQVKGTLTIGYDPFGQDGQCVWDVPFDINQSFEMVHYRSAVWAIVCDERMMMLKDFKKEKKNWDIFCWDYDQYHTFAFKLMTGGLFGGKTKTGKKLLEMLNEKLKQFNARVSLSWMGLVTIGKLKYSCTIPDGYAPKD